MRFQRNSLLELGMWLAAAGAVVAAVVLLAVKQTVVEKAAAVAVIPALVASSEGVEGEASADSALELLSRTDATVDAAITRSAAVSAAATFIPPKPPPVRPSLRGIIWTPTVGVLLEAPGLQEGGSLLLLNSSRGDFKLTAVRGDTAFVRGRDTSWVLLLRSRNQQPQ